MLRDPHFGASSIWPLWKELCLMSPWVLPYLRVWAGQLTCAVPYNLPKMTPNLMFTEKEAELHENLHQLRTVTYQIISHNHEQTKEASNVENIRA